MLYWGKLLACSTLVNHIFKGNTLNQCKTYSLAVYFIGINTAKYWYIDFKFKKRLLKIIYDAGMIGIVIKFNRMLYGYLHAYLLDFTEISTQ